MGRIFLMAVSAIIGCGKSSIMKRLRQTRVLEEILSQKYGKAVNIIFVKEPEDMWVETIKDPWTGEEHEINHLESFYAHRDIMAHAFQMFVFDTHITVIEDAVKQAEEQDLDTIILVERSMYDQMLFWKQQLRDNIATATLTHHASYVRFWKRWNKFIPQVSLIFFLRTSNLDKTMRRLKNRECLKKSVDGNKSVFHVSVDGTESEIQQVGGISRKYQSDLLELHEAFYATPYAHPPEAPIGGIPCVHLDADAPYHEEDVSLFALAEEMVPHMMAVMNGNYGEHEESAVKIVEMKNFY